MMNYEQAYQWLHGDRTEYSGCRAAAEAMEAEVQALRRDAARYRWLRNLLAVEDIHEALMNRMGVDEAESVKCDTTVDECMAADVRSSVSA